MTDDYNVMYQPPKSVQLPKKKKKKSTMDKMWCGVNKKNLRIHAEYVLHTERFVSAGPISSKFCGTIHRHRYWRWLVSGFPETFNDRRITREPLQWLELLLRYGIILAMIFPVRLTGEVAWKPDGEKALPTDRRPCRVVDISHKGPRTVGLTFGFHQWMLCHELAVCPFVLQVLVLLPSTTAALYWRYL